jgi:hypothetical protein
MMSSVRVPSDLRERLNEAAPEGTPLHRVIETILEEAGGPAEVCRQLEEASEREEARARVARLRRAGHRSVSLDEGEQVALAEAAARWCRLLEERGNRRWDPTDRELTMTGNPGSSVSSSLAGERIRPEGRFAGGEEADR